MTSPSRNRLFAVRLLLLVLTPLGALAACGAHAPRSPLPSSAPVELRDAIAWPLMVTLWLSENRVRTMERELYGQKPRLEHYVRARRALRERSTTEDPQATRVRQWIASRGADADAAGRAYYELRRMWERVALHDVLADPQTADAAAMILTSPRIRRMKLDEIRNTPFAPRLDEIDVENDAQFLELYAEYLASDLDRRVARARSFAEKAGFPLFVTEQARAHAGAETRMQLYDAYIRRETPAELEAARDEVGQLEIRLSNLYPGWPEVYAKMEALLAAPGTLPEQRREKPSEEQ